MRLGPIAVPVAIVAALFVIVAAEAGWFDGPASEPKFIRAESAPRRVAATPDAVTTRPKLAADRAASPQNDDVPALGRSIGRSPEPVAVAGGLGSGGATLDADGITSAGPQELLRQAREEAAKAKQDVLDVTRASLDAQHASEAETARQLSELNARNAALAADLDRARNDVNGLKQQLAAAPQDVTGPHDDATAKATADALARSQEIESGMRAEMAGLRAESDRKLAAAGKDAADALAARDATLAKRTDDLAQAKDKLVAERREAEALVGEVSALRRSAASLRLAAAVEASGSARTREAAATAQQRQASLGREIEALRLNNVVQADRARGSDAAARAAASKAAAAAEALDRAQGTVRDLQTRLAAATADVATGRSAVAPDATIARLKGDLEGARRGEETLRKENGMLQRQLAEAQASGRLLGEKLAALQVGTGQAKPEPLVPRNARRARGRSEQDTASHERMVHELEALRREQMHVELQGLKIEADGLADRRARRAAPGARVIRVDPTADASAENQRRRSSRPGDARFDRPAVGSPRVAAGGRDDDAQATIARARTMIRSGQLDQARRLLSEHGGAAATRALADSYNPLTNTDYGAIGVDSNADKAAYLYQQANRMATKDR